MLKFSSAKNDIMHVKYAQSDYFPTYAAAIPREDPSAKITKLFHDPIQSYFMSPHPQWRSP